MEDRIFEYLDAAQGAITQYGPDAVALALTVARISAGTQIFVGALLLLGAWILAFPVRRAVWAANPGGGYDGDWPTPRIVYALIAGVAVVVGGIGGVAAALDPFAWVGVFRPEVWIAYKAMLAVS
jgi:hypothetical protein